MRISDWSSDVCSSDLGIHKIHRAASPEHRNSAISIDRCDAGFPRRRCRGSIARQVARLLLDSSWPPLPASPPAVCEHPATVVYGCGFRARLDPMYVHGRSEEHTSELQSLMRISYAVFCLKKKNYRTSK